MTAPLGTAPGPLISPSDLAAAMNGPRPPAVLDVRWRLGGPPGEEEFARGHIPTAVFVDLDHDLAGPPGRGGRHPLPQPAVFEEAMRRCGVDGDRGVAVYDAADSTSAARCWWLLRHHGHGDVRVLDGGLRAWTAAGMPLEMGPRSAAPRRGDFTAGAGSSAVVDAEGALDIARRGVLLDARAAERYRGEVEPVDPVAGHIPGARSAPTTGNLDPDGRFRPGGALRERFAALGVAETTPVAAYCGSGVTAAHEVLALALAGVDAALYPGSWSEWVTAGTRPVVTGPDPDG